MVRQDDRTDAERVTHRFAVVARDKFLSGWGGAEGGSSRAAWACEVKHLDTVEDWVRSRSDMQHVRVVNLDTYRPPRGTAHFHVYVVNDGHPSLR